MTPEQIQLASKYNSEVAKALKVAGPVAVARKTTVQKLNERRAEKKALAASYSAQLKKFGC